jgi:threonine aldolase
MQVTTAPEQAAQPAADRADEARRRCTRFLTHHYGRSPHEVLAELAELTDPELEADSYGKGALIEGFEAEVAALLGKEAALFFPSGTMAQMIALRFWAERKGSNNVAMHPTAHLEKDENWGYQHIHGLRGVIVGQPTQLLTLAELEAVAEPLSSVLLELPQRWLGGELPAWEELTAIGSWARERSIYMHLDGARLWESGPFYGRPYAEICDLFDSVYVSFYKGLGGIAGAALAGPAELIAEARIWQHRQGGRLIRLYPYVLSAQHALATRLERMPRYHLRAVELAEALAGLPGITIRPNPPHTNMMQLYLRGDREALLTAMLDVSEENGIFMFQRLHPTMVPGIQVTELTVGDATLDVEVAEAVALFEAVFERAGGGKHPL